MKYLVALCRLIFGLATFGTLVGWLALGVFAFVEHSLAAAFGVMLFTALPALLMITGYGAVFAALFHDSSR